jgi:DNA polymerase I-like protein with 3'-5' exonuclease and polymerase domains
MPRIKECVYSLDTETTGLDLAHGAQPYFITLCDLSGDITCFEADVDPLTRKPRWSSKELASIEDHVRLADRLVLQNPRFDFKALRTLDIDIEDMLDKVDDTLTAGHLLVSNQPHDLTTMALIYLRVNIQPLEDALEIATKEAIKIARSKYPDWQLAKKGRADMPSAKDKTWKYDAWLPRAVAKAEGYSEDHNWWTVLAEYGNGDSGITLPLFLRMKQLLESKNLWRIYEERMKLLPVIYKMELNGMTMNRGRLDELYSRLTTEAEECRVDCIELADGEIEDLPVNGMSNALRHVLFEKFALKSTKKTKGGKESGDKFTLDHWLVTLPETSRPWKFVNNLRRYRKRKTAIGYMNSYRKFWLNLHEDYNPDEEEPNEWMIVYPSYNQNGTDTLRFSSQNPNAQQVSKQEETNTRYCFGPAPGREWWGVDFSNLELRIPAYESGEEEMVKLFEEPDEPPYFGSYHMMIFDTLHPEEFAEHGMKCKDVYADTWYQWTKNGNFAVQYGAVEHSGTADQAYHVPGAQRRIMSRFTRIKELSRFWIDYAKKTGYIRTLPDKTVDPERGYPLWCTRTSFNKILETVPLSYHVQGTAMWITMKAMIRCHRYLMEHITSGGKILAQIHDEILFDFPVGLGRHHIKNLAKLMEVSGDDVGIPLGTSISYHPVSWAKSEEWSVAP